MTTSARRFFIRSGKHTTTTLGRDGLVIAARVTNDDDVGDEPVHRWNERLLRRWKGKIGQDAGLELARVDLPLEKEGRGPSG